MQRCAMNRIAIPKEDAAPLTHFGRNCLLETEVKEVEGECQVCFETANLPAICPCFVNGRGCCANCLRRYFTTLVQDALYAMPVISCPLCRLRVPTASWSPFVDETVYNKYVGNAFALLSLRCPSCDSTTSFASQSKPPAVRNDSALARARTRAAELRLELQREELWGDLLAAREAALQRRKGMLAVVERHCSAEAEAQATTVADMLVEAWKRFENTEASADEFVTRLHCAFPPGQGARPSRSLRRAARTRVPGCIEDPERRVAAQLAWLRMYPKVRTTCCAAAVCFKCKVRGWHQQITCEERQLQETGREAQHCPNCQVPTMRSDGCTQIRCVCGTEWNWQEREDPSSMQLDDEDFEDDDDSDRSSNMGNSCDHLRSRTALELACLNPALQNQNIIELLLRAPGSNEKTARRTPAEVRTARAVQAGGFGQCRAGHNLKPYNILDTDRLRDDPDEWVCDECHTEASKNSTFGQRPRFRCEACDYDLCLTCFVGETVYGPVKSKARGRDLPEEDEEVQSHQQFDIGDDKAESETPTRYRPPGRSLGVRGRAVGGRKSRRRAKAYADKGSDESDEEIAESSGKDHEPESDSFWTAFRDEGNVPEPSSSSSQRPEFREALKDMAGVLDHWRSDRPEVAEALAEVAEAPEAAEAAAALPTKLPSTPVPLHCAVRSGNRRSLEACLKWCPPTEVALQELVKLSFTERQPMEELFSAHMWRMSERAVPLFARICFGMTVEDSKVSFSQVLGTLPFIALHRQGDPVLHERYSKLLRQVLGDEWFEAANQEALTQQLLEELLAARHRALDLPLVRDLLAAGANMMETSRSTAAGCDGESVDDEEKAESLASTSSISPWCPVPEAARSCAELLAMRDDVTDEMVDWIMTPAKIPGGSASWSEVQSLFKQQRLLKIAMWSCNVRLIRRLLAAWGGRPLHSSAWRALRFMTDPRRKDVEDMFRLYIAERSLQTVEVPFWAMIQLGRKEMRPEEAQYAPPSLREKVASTVTKMHTEACSTMEAAFGTEDAAAFPLDALAAIHKCDADTKAVFQNIINATKLSRPVQLHSSVVRRSKRAATRELLWELRRALCEKRTPDMALAARLLDSGATMRPREASSDDERSDDEEMGRPGGPRFSTDFDDAPRNCLDLLALNRFADPKQLEFAIKKAVEYNADPNHAGYEKPLALAVRGRNLTAVNTLLSLGATVDRQALAALRYISDVRVRHEIEGKFLAAFQRGECSSTLKVLKDVSLWIIVQSGNVKAAKKRLKDQSDSADAGVLLALRRCRDGDKKELRRIMVEKFGERSVAGWSAEAATYELVTELREALIDKRDPDEELVRELVRLGANTQARGVELDNYILEHEDDDESVDLSDSDSDLSECDSFQ